MTDAAPSPRPAPSHDGAAAAGDTTLYFSVALGLSWVALTPASLAALGYLPGAPEEYMAAAPLAVFSPTIAAVVATRREGGWPAVRAFFRRIRQVGGVHPGWYVLALALPAILWAAGRAVYGLFGENGGDWFYPPRNGQEVAAMFLVPFFEEIGWRGYALPRLTARHGAVRASLLLGVLWALWHIGMFVSTGSTLTQMVWLLPYFVCGTLLYTWLFLRTGGSVLAAFLIHFGGHLDNPHRALPENDVPFYVVNVAFIVAGLLVLLDRKTFAGRAPRPS